MADVIQFSDAVAFIKGGDQKDNKAKNVLLIGEPESGIDAAPEFAAEFSNYLRRNTKWAITPEDTHTQSPATKPTRLQPRPASKQAVQNGETSDQNGGPRNTPFSNQQRSRTVNQFNGRRGRNRRWAPRDSASQQVLDVEPKPQPSPVFSLNVEDFPPLGQKTNGPSPPHNHGDGARLELYKTQMPKSAKQKRRSGEHLELTETQRPTSATSARQKRRSGEHLELSEAQTSKSATRTRQKRRSGECLEPNGTQMPKSATSARQNHRDEERLEPGVSSTAEAEGSQQQQETNNTLNSTLKLDNLAAVSLAEANPEDVTHENELDRLIQLYLICLQRHIFPSLSSEVYFVGQLLTASPQTSTPISMGFGFEEQNYLCSVHNIVYFATGVLSSLTELLKHFEKPTLVLFGENKRLKDFKPSIHEELKPVYENMEDTTIPSADHLGLTAPFGFEIPADFAKTKILRDTFPELLRTWEVKHSGLDWSLQKLSFQIGEMFKGADVSFYVCFSRIFVNHLFMASQETEDNFCSTDCEKTMKLQERLTKVGNGGPCPPPSFPGKQKFFLEFLEIVKNPVLNQHLLDLLKFQILQLNDSQFGSKTTNGKEDTDSDTKEVKNVEDKFKVCLLTLKTYARFVGYLTFLPYQDSDKIPQQLHHDFIMQRNLTALPLDLVGCLQSAIEEDRLALTVPWIVDFLAMSDALAQNTEPVKRILAELRHLLKRIGPELKNHDFAYEGLLVMSSIGWLFEQPSLDGFYYSPDTQMDVSDSLLLQKLKHVVTRNLFYLCCPYFDGVQHLLSEFSQGRSVKSHLRKINLCVPVSVMPPKRLDLHTEENKKIQQDLMEIFCQHSISEHTYGVLQMVSDMIYNSAIKRFTRTILEPVLAESVRRAMSLDTLAAEARLAHNRFVKAVETRLTGCFCSLELIGQLLLPQDTTEDIRRCVVRLTRVQLEKKIQEWRHSTYMLFYKKMRTKVKRLPNKEVRQNGQLLKKAKESDLDESDSRHSDVDSKSAAVLPDIVENDDNSGNFFSFTLGGFRQIVSGSGDGHRSLKILSESGRLILEVPFDPDQHTEESPPQSVDSCESVQSPVSVDWPEKENLAGSSKGNLVSPEKKNVAGSPKGDVVSEPDVAETERTKKGKNNKLSSPAAATATCASVTDAGDRAGTTAAHDCPSATMADSSVAPSAVSGVEADSKPHLKRVTLNASLLTPSADKLEPGVVVYILRETQDLLRVLTIDGQDIERHRLMVLLHTANRCLTENYQTFQMMSKSVQEGLEQLAVAIIYLQPSLWTRNIAGLFVDFWKKTTRHTNEKLVLVCQVHTLVSLKEKPNQAASLQHYESLLIRLVTEELITVDQKEETLCKVVRSGED